MLSNIPINFKINISNNNAGIKKFPKNSFFINNFENCSVTAASYKIISSEQDVAQLGSTSVLGVTDYTNQKYCNYKFKDNITVYLSKVSEEKFNVACV